MSIEDVLNRLPDFGSLSEQDLQALSAALEPRSFSDGDRIIEQGREGNGAHFVVSGTVRVELFGVIAMIDHRPRSASCIAIGDVETAFLSRQAFEMLAHRHATVAYPFQRAVGAQVAADFREVVERIRGRLKSS
ncbi:MAG: cyclic nucleotide-binding domain-containing protein [Proteobacteria bacterium]|nr:cyclic nucleotide-binding domain-containing protein [Pseudomonadota bacterium]